MEEKEKKKEKIYTLLTTNKFNLFSSYIDVNDELEKIKKFLKQNDYPGRLVNKFAHFETLKPLLHISNP